MGNRGADEVIGLGKSWHGLQSPGVGRDCVVCIHLNYNVMVRPEITLFIISLCGLGISSLKHGPGVVYCKHVNSPTGYIQYTEFRRIARIQGIC